MPVDMQKLMQNKETIIKTLQSNGPSLPVQIAREVNLSMLFASAYLSEIYNERKIKMSNMKVGSSSIYYLPGQEAQLENFIQYLNHREKEAFSLLKSQKMLDDEKQEPAIRVALRAIKDFAIPIRIKFDNESKLFWKHFLISDEEIKSLAQELIKPGKKPKHEEKEEKEKQKTLVREHKEGVIPSQELVLPTPKKEIEHKPEVAPVSNMVSPAANTTPPVQEEMHKKPAKEKKKKAVEESKFVKNIKEYILSKDIELLAVNEEKKKDLIAKVRIDAAFGKQEYLLIAREKKKITEEDITIALHKAQSEKMPALFMSPGEIDKKALDHAKLWRNLVKFEKVKF